jgi:hypothetical protein
VPYYGPQIASVRVPLKNRTENINDSEEHVAFLFGIELVIVNMNSVYTCRLKGEET